MYGEALVVFSDRLRIFDGPLRSVEKARHHFAAPQHVVCDKQAAGPQKQVMADHGLVYTWLEYANRDVPGCGDDGLVIAFAKFGVLGMAELGNGLANCGHPSNAVTVHEFGHAFVGLYDEYSGNPAPPPANLIGINVTSDLKNVPWQHFLDKKVKGGYTYGDFPDVIGQPEVHASGEIWSQTLWDLRTRLGDRAFWPLMIVLSNCSREALLEALEPTRRDELAGGAFRPANVAVYITHPPGKAN